MKEIRRDNPNQTGFTMIEVIAVLVVIAIVSAAIISRAKSPSQYSVVSETDILKNNIRFAQIKAIGDISPDTWGINVTSSSYTLTCTGANCPGSTVNLPGESSATHTFSSGVTASPATNITFDNWGSPGAANITITLTGVSQTQTVMVTKNTGFMQ